MLRRWDHCDEIQKLVFLAFSNKPRKVSLRADEIKLWFSYRLHAGHEKSDLIKSESSLEHKSAKKLNTSIALFFYSTRFGAVPEALLKHCGTPQQERTRKCNPTSGRPNIPDEENLFWIDQKT